MFTKLTNNQSYLYSALTKIDDYRKSPIIPLQTILLATITKMFFGCKSINQLDHFLKEEHAKILFSTQARPMVASATTIYRTHENIKKEQFKGVLTSFSLYTYTKTKWRGLKNKIIFSVDGSYFGGVYVSCLEVAGNYPVIIGYKPYEFGNELNATYSLLKEEFSVLGKHHIYADIVCADGLYLNKEFFNLCIDNNSNPFVKYTPARDAKKKPSILEEGDRIFDSKIFEGKGVIYKEFYDKKREEDVKIWYGEGFQMSGVGRGVNVMRVEEKSAKKSKDGKAPGQDKEDKGSVYYIISTYKFVDSYREDELTLEDARELAKGEGRWSVEIEGFRWLNQNFATRRKWCRKEGSKFENKFETFLVATFIGYNLFHLYLYILESEIGIIEWRSKKKYKTKIRIMMLLGHRLIILAVQCRISLINSS